MKKLSLPVNTTISILFFLGFMFSFTQTSSATQGACSYHNGVNCSAGGNIDGKVVCNDGWVNSSVYFYQTDECKPTTENEPVCYLEYTSCSIASINALEQSAVGSDGAMQARAGMLGSTMGEAQSASIHAEYQQQRNACQAEIDAKNSRYNFCLSMASSVSTRNDTQWASYVAAANASLKMARINVIFEKSFMETMAAMPEYEGIVNEDVIKTLSLDPANQSKTFAQLIKETYADEVAKKKEWSRLSLLSTTIITNPITEMSDTDSQVSKPKLIAQKIASPTRDQAIAELARRKETVSSSATTTSTMLAVKTAFNSSSIATTSPIIKKENLVVEFFRKIINLFR